MWTTRWRTSRRSTRPTAPERPRTVVAVNAHPDDEALLMAGTLAQLAERGHRVVLVVATDGDLGLTSADHRAGGRLGERRLAELEESARALGAGRVVDLGFGDSGMTGDVPPDAPGRVRLLRADVEAVADAVAAVLREERADVVIGYDRAGGYGHRDHVRIHEVVRLAAARADTPRLLEATVPRETIWGTLRLLRRLRLLPGGIDVEAFGRSYSPRAAITHRVDVRRQAGAKRRAMAAHASQAAADDGADRTLAAFLRIPRPLYDVVFGREWFVDPGRPPGAGVSGDILEGLP